MNWEIVGLALAALLWATWLGRIWALHRSSSDYAQRRECASFLAAALCLTLQLPTAAAAVDRLVGIYDMARLLGNIAGISAAWLFYPCMLRLWQPYARGRDILANGWLMLSTIATLIGIFILFPARTAGSPVLVQAVSPFTIYHQSFMYTLVYMAYLGSIVFRMLVLSLRDGLHVFRSRATPSRLRRQLAAQSLGWAAGVGFALQESVHAFLRQQGLTYPLTNPALVSNGLLIVAVLGVAGGELGIPWRWVTQYRSYRRLYPLWHMLHVAAPSIALTALFSPSESAVTDTLKIDRITLRRLRRVIEIRDGILAVRPFAEERAATRADELCRQAKLADAERQAVVDATLLVVASCARDLVTQTGHISNDLDALHFISPETFDEEVDYLERLANAVTHSPIVAAVVAERRTVGRLAGAASPSA